MARAGHTWHGLDPEDWSAFRTHAHLVLDHAIDQLRDLESGPVWQPMPGEIRASFDEPLPVEPSVLSDVTDQFRTKIAPYAGGNLHPRFFGWVQGGGTAVGMLAELLAGALDANLGGRDHAPIEVERQVVRWMRTLFGFPATASGILVTGTSLANWMAVIVAKTYVLGRGTRAQGLPAEPRRLRAYASTATHGCVQRAFELSGLGGDTLVPIAVDEHHRIDLAALRTAIARDRAAGLFPFMVIGNAGTVDIGAIDDLEGLADLAVSERMWLHVDGAFGALGVLAPSLRPRLAGLGRADSIACDFHKWLQVPYDAGLLLVRDGTLHANAFATGAAYLQRASRGLAAGAPWPTDFGPDLSRGFRALKVWFTFKAFGTRRLGGVIAHTCELAQHLAALIREQPALELLAPVALNIVCFRYRHVDADRVNEEIVLDLQESGVAAPSTTRIGGALAIRVAIVNHRSRYDDITILVEAVLRRGRELTTTTRTPPPASA
jgi:glutamate/tyrosine decarboxylase-like PLP-dependent enzyme